MHPSIKIPFQLFIAERVHLRIRSRIIVNRRHFAVKRHEQRVNALTQGGLATPSLYTNPAFFTYASNPFYTDHAPFLYSSRLLFHFLAEGKHIHAEVAPNWSEKNHNTCLELLNNSLRYEHVVRITSSYGY